MNTSCEVDSRSATYEIPHLLWNPDSITVFTRAQHWFPYTSVYILPFFKIHFITILPCMLRFSNRYRLCRHSERNFCVHSHLSRTSYKPAHQHSLLSIGSQIKPVYIVSSLRSSLLLFSPVSAPGSSKPYLSFRLSQRNLVCTFVSNIRPTPRQQYLTKNQNYEAPHALFSSFLFLCGAKGRVSILAVGMITSSLSRQTNCLNINRPLVTAYICIS